MDDRAGLIERAAARLRESVSPAAARDALPPLEAPVSPTTRPLKALPLKRHVVLDRAHLAQTGIIMPWTSSGRIVEEFRIIKRNIMSAWQASDSGDSATDRPRIIMVTSARPREGKTFSSINLALAFAAEDSFVTILVDGDTVRGDVAKDLKIPSEPGLTNILSGETSLLDALIQTDLPNLVVLPPGPSGHHVPELLSSQAPSALFDEIGKRYPKHVIILDTPPCLASTDPAALAPIVSQIVFVIEAGHTQRPEIESALSLITGGPQVSIVLNLSSGGTSEHFGSYSYYFQAPKQQPTAQGD